MSSFRRLLAPLLLVGPLGCEEPVKEEVSLQYRITPDAVELGSVRYDQDDPPSITVSVFNLDTRTLLVTASAPTGEGSGFVTVNADNFDEVNPDKSADIQVGLVDDVLLWDGGSYDLSLTITVGAEVEAGDTGGETTWAEETVVVPITVTIDCDLDDDGAESVTTGGDDCDDAIAAINPSATELCNEADDDCDGFEDEDDAADALIWYRDGDDDDYGATDSTTMACEEPDGFVANGSDCDDGNAEVYPGATEECNGLDDDCDDAVDEEPECAVTE